MFIRTKLAYKVKFLTLTEVLEIHKNHPFFDGNKRVGAVAALVFLALNGCRAPRAGFSPCP